VLVTDAYERRCAVTGEKTLPVLEAAHIKPYAQNGPHRVDNGSLLRSDLHKLFDLGYVTVTPDLRVRVSRRLKAEWHNERTFHT
jgi:putative restriction endonuclease